MLTICEYVEYQTGKSTTFLYICEIFKILLDKCLILLLVFLEFGKTIGHTASRKSLTFNKHNWCMCWITNHQSIYFIALAWHHIAILQIIIMAHLYLDVLPVAVKSMSAAKKSTRKITILIISFILIHLW